MTFYIVDTTLTPSKVARFDSYKGIVTYLNEVSKRRYGTDRKNRMLMLEELGHGYDDSDAVNFVRSMTYEFEMGIIREGNRMRCDITNQALFQKEEFGN